MLKCFLADIYFASLTAPGELVQGPCPGSINYPISISNCFQITLSSDPTKNLDPGFLDSPRQRVEFLTPAQDAGTDFAFTWKMYLSSNAGTSTHFFHLMQVFSRDDNGPIVTLDALSGKITVKDYIRTSASVPSIALSDYTDYTTVHTIQGTYGSNGTLAYVVKNSNGTQLLAYSASGYMGSDAS